MKKIICLLIVVAQIMACATYKKSASFMAPKYYKNFQNSYGVLIGAESFNETKEVEQAFAFDVSVAALLPIQVVIDNTSAQGVEIVSGQTFIIDENNRYWKILSNREVVDRLKKAHDTGAMSRGVAKGTTVDAAAETLLDLTIGITSERELNSKNVKTVNTEGISVAVVKNTNKAEEDRLRETKLSKNIREKGIEGKILSPEYLAGGFIFFPGEAASAKELRLQVKFRGDGRIQTLNIKLR